MPSQNIDANLCTQCGQCVQVCPSYVYEQQADTVSVNTELASRCVQCGHCMAICPTQAVTVGGMAYNDFADLPASAASADELRALMLRRRSIRAFKSDPVAREVLEQVVAAAATAPMGFPPTGVEVTVLASRQAVEPLVPATVKMVQSMQKMLGSALGRLIFRRLAGAKTLQVMTDYLLPLMPRALADYERDGTDPITWNAPALLIFHVSPQTISGETDAMIAETYAMLMAEALGVGSIMLGLAGAALGRDAQLKQRLGVPAANQVFSVLALGYTDRVFLRAIPRSMAGVTWMAD